MSKVASDAGESRLSKEDHPGSISTGDITRNISVAIGPGASSVVHLHITFSGPTVIRTTDHGVRLSINPNYQAGTTPSFSPHIDSETEEATRLIGRTTELCHLAALYEHALKTGQGRIVFLTGEHSFGRRALGRAFVDAIRKGGGNAAIGRFWPTDQQKFTWRDTRWQLDLKRLQEEHEAIPDYLNTDAYFPLQAVLAQLTRYPVAEATLPELPAELSMHLRSLTAGRKPAIILLEDFEFADPEWMQLV
jgi:hypothetical protein